MTVIAVSSEFAKTEAADLGDSAPCPNCGTAVAAPKSSDYRGLGRIEHSWHCGACGTNFRTMASVAGLIEVEALVITADAA
jgi:hypothetical protein